MRSPLVLYGKSSATVAVRLCLRRYSRGKWSKWHCCAQKLLQTVIFLHSNVPRREIFASATHCCAQKLRLAAIFAQSDISLAHMVHERCTLRVHQVRQRCNMHPSCVRAVQNALHLHAGVHCTYSVHWQGTHRCTLNLPCTLSLHCEVTMYTVRELNGHSAHEVYTVSVHTGA